MSKLVRASALFFALIFIFALLFSPTVSAKENNDYSRPGYSGGGYNEIFGAVEFLREKLDVSVGTVESEYLTETSDFYLSYPKNIPGSYAILVALDNAVAVKAKPYVYKNSEGVEIEWIPETAVYEKTGETLTFVPSGAEYEAIFHLPSQDPTAKFSINYYYNVTVPRDTVNGLLSKAYRDAEYYDYLEKLLSYESALEIYKSYLVDKKAYDELYLEYEEYLSDLEAYEEAMELYEAYEAALEKYEADYVLYLESEKKAESLKDDIAKYNEYLAKLEIINYRLSLFNDTKLAQIHDRSIYWAIKSGAVDQVLANEDLLVSNVIGADKEVIKDAGDATESLRNQLDAYFALKTDSEKYSHYITNYTAFRDDMAKLFRSLDKLYRNFAISSYIQSEGKGEKFEILLAQLYYAVLAISDEPVYDYDGNVYNSSYKIDTSSGYKKPYEIIGDVSNYYVDKNIATPTGETYPTPVPKPDYTPFPEPTKPAKVEKPTKPAEVLEPIAPPLVEEPEEPVKINNPGGITATAPFAEGSLEARLIAAFKRGELSPREEHKISSDFLRRTSIVLKKALGAETVTVYYYNDIGGSCVGTAEVDKGSFPEINYTPTKPATGSYKFVFDSWVDENGNEVDLSCVNADIEIYPAFRKIPIIRYYSITFVVGDKRTTVSLQEGSIPTPPQNPTLAGDFNSYYEFSGWSPSISRVTSDATYTATFAKKPTVPELPENSITLSSSTLSVSCKESFGKKLDVEHLLEMAAGNYSVDFVFDCQPKARGFTNTLRFKLTYADVLSMQRSGVSYLEFYFDNLENEEFRVRAFSRGQIELSEKYKLTVEYYTEKNGENMHVVYYENGEKYYAKSSLSDGKLSFVLNTGAVYSYVEELTPLRVAVLPQDGITLIVGVKEATPGDIITLECSVPKGTELISLYYLDENNVKTVISDFKFEMPRSEVRIGAEFRKIVYTVNFYSDGKLVSSAEYFYGEAVSVPSGVYKASDENYSYTFKSWSPEIVVVTADADYVAVYEKTPIEKRDEGGLKISEGVLRILITCGIAGGVFVFGFLPSAIVTLTLMFRRKRRGAGIRRKK